VVFVMLHLSEPATDKDSGNVLSLLAGTEGHLKQGKDNQL